MCTYVACRSSRFSPPSRRCEARDQLMTESNTRCKVAHEAVSAKARVGRVGVGNHGARNQVPAQHNTRSAAGVHTVVCLQLQATPGCECRGWGLLWVLPLVCHSPYLAAIPPSSNRSSSSKSPLIYRHVVLSLQLFDNFRSSKNDNGYADETPLSPRALVFQPHEKRKSAAVPQACETGSSPNSWKTPVTPTLHRPDTYNKHA